jgi:hypothetical protein
MENATWYLLFGGTSVDGAGPAKYCGRTVFRDIAQRHFLESSGDPYSVVYVVKVTDAEHLRGTRMGELR